MIKTPDTLSEIKFKDGYLQNSKYYLRQENSIYQMYWLIEAGDLNIISNKSCTLRQAFPKNNLENIISEYTKNDILVIWCYEKEARSPYIVRDQIKKSLIPLVIEAGEAKSFLREDKNIDKISLDDTKYPCVSIEDIRKYLFDKLNVYIGSEFFQSLKEPLLLDSAICH